MDKNAPRPGPAGSSDQKPRWEGPPESRPPGYLPATDDPEIDPDANGETNSDRIDHRDALTRKDRK